MISNSMQNIVLIKVKLSHSQSTFRNGSVVDTTVIREFTLQTKTRSTMSDNTNIVVHLAYSKCLCDKNRDMNCMVRA